MGLIAAGIEAHIVDRPGGIFVRRAEQMSERGSHPAADRWRASSSPIGAAALAEQVDAGAAAAERADAARFAPDPQRSRARRAPVRCSRARDLHSGQRPRRIHARRPRVRDHDRARIERRRRPGSTCSPTRTSAPSISESGSAYTWSENAHEFRLTPWHNDPVSDAGGEAFYLRDEETGHFWSPTPLALPRSGRLRHAPRIRLQRLRARRGRHRLRAVGVRRDRRGGEVLGAEAAQRLGPAAPAFGHRLSSNGCWATCGRRRRCTSITEVESRSGALLARNSYNTEFRRPGRLLRRGRCGAHA